MLDALQRSGSSFKNMNFNTAETISLISALSTDVAKAGRNIGVSMTSLLSNIDFKKAKDALAAYKIEVYDEDGKMRRGVEIWRDIQRVFNGLDDKHANEFALAMSGGKFRINDLKAILDNWQEFEKILSRINKEASPETTAKLLQTGLSSYQNNLDRLAASLQVFGVVLGNEVLPAMKSMVVGLTEGIQWLIKHKDTVDLVISGLSKFAAILVTYRLAQFAANTEFGKFTSAMINGTSSIATYGGGLAGLGNKFLGLAKTVGIAALQLVMFESLVRAVGNLNANTDRNDFKQRIASETADDGRSRGRPTTQYRSLSK